MSSHDQVFIDAVKKGDSENVKTLISEDRARVNAHADTGESAILLAMYYGQRGIANLLWDYGAEMNIWEASAVGATELVKELVEHDPALVQEISPDGFTPLQLAAFFGNADTAEWLVNQGADVNAISRNQTFARGVPILQSAVASGRSEVVKILLEHGANPNVVNQNEGTPLYLAALEGKADLVELLLAHGADPNMRTKGGETPREIAMKKDHAQVVALLDHR